MTTDDRPQARQSRNEKDTAPSRGETTGTLQRSGIQGAARRGSDYGLARRDQDYGLPSLFTPPMLAAGGPFAWLRRMEQEMDRMFEQFGLTTGWGQGGQLQRGLASVSSLWTPQIEVYQRDGKLHVCADLPGMKKEDIQLDIDDDQMTIQGERRSSEEDRSEGFYRSERSYGSFYRTIPLPEGVNAESAKATFRDGVLDITFDAPPEQRRRKVEIQDARS